MTDAQDRFNAALFDPGLPPPVGLQDGAGRPAGRRFDVYRNNVSHSLTEALRIGFPVITKLIGRQNMDGLAGIYLRAHPPRSPLMMQYGAGFPAFLASNTQLSHLGYLADIARLELALRRAYHAGDADAIAPDLLADIPPEILVTTTLLLAPAVQVIRSDWPIHDIWRFNTDDSAAKPRAQAQDVLITRPEFDPVPQLLPPGGARWIDELRAGRTIGEALDAALAEVPEFDMGKPLTLLLQGGAVISLTQKDRP